jgi:hypothetical protein
VRFVNTVTMTALRTTQIVMKKQDSESESETIVVDIIRWYKERDPTEGQLWDMMSHETGAVLASVSGTQAGAGRLPVEIWLVRIRGR